MKILFIAAFDSPHIRRWYDFFDNQKGITTELFIAKNHIISNNLSSKIKYYFHINKLIQKTISEFKPDIINIHTVLFPNYLIPKYYKGKLVVTPWNGDILWQSYGKEVFFINLIFTSLARKIKESRISNVLNKASLITYNSYKMGARCKSLLSKEVRLERVQVPGVDNKLLNTSFSKSEVRSRLGIPDNKIVILSMRGLSEYYNLDIIAQSIKRVIKKYPNVLFVIKYLGTEGLDKIIEITKKENVSENVKFVGEIDYNEMLLYYRASDIGISVSSVDSCPQSVLEGMANKLPMIVGEIPVTREIIENEKNGLLVPCRDKDKLADAILYLIENPQFASEIGSKGREIIIAKHDYQRNMERMLQLYKEVFEEN